MASYHDDGEGGVVRAVLRRKDLIVTPPPALGSSAPAPFRRDIQ
jgi:hypothetical protein